MNFTTNLIPQVYNITLKSSDSFLTIYKSYQLVTQSSVDFIVNTAPINVSVLSDDGGTA